MHTMEQLGNDINKTLSPSVSGIKTGVATPSYKQSKQVVSTLEKDIQKLGIGLQKSADAIYKTSEYAHKLVAVDALNQYSLGSQKIDEYFYDKLQRGEALTSKDYEQWIEWKDEFHREMVNNKKLPDDAKEYGDIYKTTFIKPALEQYFKEKSTLQSNYLQAVKKETIEATKKKIEERGHTYDKNTFEADVATLEKLGVDNARVVISTYVANTYNTKWKEVMYNGILSEAFQDKLTKVLNGEMKPEQAFREQFNAIYGQQLILDENGKYHKANPNLTDEAEASMIKTFTSFVNNALGKDKKKKYSVLTPQLNKSTDVFNTDISTAQQHLAQSEDELKKLAFICKGGDEKACSKFEELRIGAYLDLKKKVLKIDKLNKIWDDFNKNPNNIYSNDYSIEIQAYDKTTGKNVVLREKISREDINRFIGAKLKDEYDVALQNGNISSAETIAYKAKVIHNNGGDETPIASTLKRQMDAINRGDFSFNDSFNTPEKLLAYVTAVTTYNTSGSGAVFSGSGWINQQLVNELSQYYNDLKKRAETDKSLDNKTITQLLKTKLTSVKIENDKMYASDEFTKQAIKALQIKLKKDKLEPDDFVSFYVAGDGQFAFGTLETAIHNTCSKGGNRKICQDAEALRDKLQKSFMVMDNARFPIFANRMIMYIPDSVKLLESIDDDKNGKEAIQEHFYYQLNRKLQAYKDQTGRELSLWDLTDDNTQVHQVNYDGKTYTLVDIFNDSGTLLHTVEISEDEWAKRLSEEELRSIRKMIKESKKERIGKQKIKLPSMNTL